MGWRTGGTSTPLLKILPVDWGYTIPFGLLHAPDPAPPVAKFLRAVAKAVKARKGCKPGG